MESLTQSEKEVNSIATGELTPVWTVRGRKEAEMSD